MTGCREIYIKVNADFRKKKWLRENNGVDLMDELNLKKEALEELADAYNYLSHLLTKINDKDSSAFIACNKAIKHIVLAYNLVDKIHNES